MKKIIISLGIIGVVAAAVISGTIAYFSDTETATGNTFTAGTIDIAVNGENPWSQTNQYVFEDMKPSQVEYSNFTINNVGTNPVNIWKRVKNVTVVENGINEPECIAYQGTWNGSSCSFTGDAINNLDSVITYDLSVKLKNASDVVVWEQTLYNMDKTIAEIKDGSGTFLGMIPEDWSMDVVESYHMKGEEAGNQYQSDKMTFDIELFAEQLRGTLVLEDKDSSANWRVKSESAPKVTVTYGVKDATLKISSIAGQTVVAGDHSLITYPEAYSTPSGAGWPGTGVVLATVTTNGSGVITGYTQVVNEPGTFQNMKVWLVPNTDLNAGTAVFSSWNDANYMFDTGLADYYDSF